MKSTGLSSSLARAGALGAATPAAAAGAAQASAQVGALAPVAAAALDGVRFASTWPRGWMAAAVPQQVREFNLQTSRAQLAQQFLGAWGELLETLARLAQRQARLPSDAAKARTQAALDAAQALWSERHARTLGSLDETLAWSASAPARRRFVLGGWNAASLQATHGSDRELIAFCLIGQDHEHGAWLADALRSSHASRFALACALAPLGVQLDEVSEARIVVSVDERRAAQVAQRLMVRGGGRRFPAGQWQAPRLAPGPQAVLLPVQAHGAGLAGLDAELPALRERLAQTQLQIAQFQRQAGASLALDAAPPLARLQDFAQRFAAAADAPAYDWVQAVAPAVRALARSRVARLLRRAPASP